MKLVLEILKKNIDANLDAHKALLNDAELHDTFNSAVQRLIECYRSGGRLYIAGNGGSAADAQHLAAEFVSRLARDRAPLPAEALTVDSSILTAIGNDYGFEFIFSRQLTAKLTSRDVFLAITTSGESLNIINALEKCQAMGVPSILLTGRNGGLAKSLADYAIVVPGQLTSTIQEVHILLAHTLCEYVELALFGD